jgi:hypothetical protein
VAEPLAAWVKANIKYSYVLEKIEPLEREQNELRKYVHNNLLSFIDKKSPSMSLVFCREQNELHKYVHITALSFIG